jgi:hypothetical protein
MAALEETNLTPADHGFYPAARQAVVDMGIVRRRKVDVAADIPARRVADLPVELDGAVGRSIREAERELARAPGGALRAIARRTLPVAGEQRRLRRHRPRAGTPGRRRASARTPTRPPPARTSSRWCAASARPRPASPPTTPPSWPAASARWSSSPSTSTSWTPPRRPSPPRHQVHLDPRRPDPEGAQKNIDGFVEDPEVQVIVCSLTAAGVGINLQVASNVVLSELSWTDAEQTQAIDRCTASARPSRSPRGGSSPRRPSTPASPS